MKPSHSSLTACRTSSGRPAAVVTSHEGDQIYIADGANGRILEFSKEGKFRRQFRAAEPTAFTDLRSLYLDEGTRLFYILAADTLYKADLPQSGQVDQPAEPVQPANLPNPVEPANPPKLARLTRLVNRPKPARPARPPRLPRECLVCASSVSGL